MFLLIKKIIAAAASFAAFILFTVLVKKVDVGTDEATGRDIGFFKLNIGFHKLTGFSEGWYKLTQILGIVIIACGLVFAVIGVIELIKRKDLRKVDAQIYALGGLYVILGILYIVFDKIVAINYRPVIMDGETAPEASFPSSHTMLAIVVMAGVMIMLNYYIRDRRLRISLQAICALLALLTVVGRLISGVHWFTDIIGSILISAFLVSMFMIALDILERRGLIRVNAGKDDLP